jgi:hypothetical protein
MCRLRKPRAKIWRGLRSRIRGRSAPISSAIVAMLIPASLLAGALLVAQASPAPAPTAEPAHKTASAQKRSAEVQPAAQPQPTPPAPPPPDWPANDPPAPANVVWDSHGLLVVASNSSLKQILKDVSTDTGAKIEGLNQDERIFGTYGPGPARDVISQLLDGSSYDVLIVGDQGQGTPRRVVLTARSSAAPASSNASPSQPSEEDTGAEEQAQEPQPDEPQPQVPQTEQPRVNPNGNAAPVPARTQEQLIEEMQERQRQLQQQQQQQQNPQ